MTLFAPPGPKGRISVPGNAGFKVVRSVAVNRPAAQLYRFWREFHTLAQFMNHVVSVVPLSATRSHWVVRGPGGKHIEWDAQIINEHPDELIAWRTLEHPDVAHAGSVRFKPLGLQRTEVTVSLEYLPPAGKLGVWVAKLLGEDPGSEIEEDLQRFKNIVERGA
jgi:uncharacterized membrane protein